MGGQSYPLQTYTAGIREGTMEELLEALNGLVSDGIVAGYAIGGAIGASFYLQALQTEDVDAFVYLKEAPVGLILLDDVYRALVERGGVIEGLYVRFGAWPLQILTDANDLLREAIRESVPVAFGRVSTRVFRAEHLFAVALQTGRAKDYLRAGMLLEQGAVDAQHVRPLLARYDLLDGLQRIPNTNVESWGVM